MGCYFHLVLKEDLKMGITQWIDKPAENRISFQTWRMIFNTFGSTVFSAGWPSLRTGCADRTQIPTDLTRKESDHRPERIMGRSRKFSVPILKTKKKKVNIYVIYQFFHVQCWNGPPCGLRMIFDAIQFGQRTYGQISLWIKTMKKLWFAFPDFLIFIPRICVTRIYCLWEVVYSQTAAKSGIRLLEQTGCLHLKSVDNKDTNR